jgi:REP element-mobilizing transposase RayT
MSRVVDKRKIMGDVEREYFVSLMKEYATFCGVRVLTYCIMKNHFHVLVEVPAPKKDFTDEELLQRLEKLSGMTHAGMIRQQLESFRKQGWNEQAEMIRKLLLDRMFDVSAFMKILKQRFTQWYNRRNRRTGTLWEQRFRSVLVQGNGETLATMAAYIDLNPVRAGLVEDPRDYRWCGYAAALGGDAGAVEGLKEVLLGVGREGKDAKEVLADYRVWMVGKGEEREGLKEDGTPLRKGFSREEALAVIAAKGQLPVEEYLRCRVRYFTDGAVLGSREFVNEIFEVFKERFGSKRKDGARRIKGLELGIYTLRNLQKSVFG